MFVSYALDHKNIKYLKHIHSNKFGMHIRSYNLVLRSTGCLTLGSQLSHGLCILFSLLFNDFINLN